MKTKKKALSRAISVLLVLAMMLGCMAIPGLGTVTTYADSGAVLADVYVSFQSGGYVVPKQKIEVSSDLAEAYGYADSVSPSSAVSALDVLVKAHLIKEKIKTVPDQNDIDTINDMLKVGGSGYITKVMGVSTANFGFAINGKVPNDGTLGTYGYNGYTINQAALSAGDDVEFFVYQDEWALDHYAWFEQNGKKVSNLTTLPNSDLQLKVNGYPIGWYGLNANPSLYYVAEDTQIVTIVPVTGEAKDWPGKRTDADDGTVTLSFSTPGSYVISAYTDGGDIPLIMPWLNITVIDPEDNLPENVPENDVNAYVTITDADAAYVIKQALNIGWFDIRPFMDSGAENYVLSDKILTANALIEGVYYKLYGKDPSRADLAVPANSTTAQAIRANLNIYNGSYGLSTGSVFGNSKLVMSVINDDFGAAGIGGDAIHSGDDIVFYPWDKEYSYFNLMKLETSSATHDKAYLVFNVKLKVLEKTYPSTVSAVSGAGIYAVGESWCYGTTGTDGTASAEFMRNPTPQGELLITANGKGVIQPYLRIQYTWDGSHVTVTKVSQGLIADTSLREFTLNAYGTALDAADYSGGKLAFDVDADIQTVTLTAISTDSDASLINVTVIGTGTKTVNFPASNGGSISIPLDSGLNGISFQVNNGKDEETYSLKINRMTGSSSALVSANRVLDGITGYNGYPDSTYDYNWIIGKLGAGKTISAAEKDAFLTQVMAAAKSLNVGSAAKMAIALTALNIDATKVPAKDSDDVINLVAQVYDCSDHSISYISYVPYMLMLEDLGNYSVPSSAKWGREELIQYALDNYSGAAGWKAENGIENAAMMIPALAPYYKSAGKTGGCNGISEASCAAIKIKVDEVVGQLKALQKPNGSFDNNSDATAVVIAALASLGMDADGSDFTQAASRKSALDALFAYETADNRLGYTSKTYNEYSTKDGLLALASYLEYYSGGTKNGDGCAFRFTKDVKPYTSWPNKDLLTSIKVTAPINTVYSYNEAETNYAPDTSGIVITGIYNGEASNTKNIPIGACTVSTINRSTAGEKTVTVSYQGYTASFLVTVLKSDGNPLPKNTVSVKVKSNSAVFASENSMAIEEGKTTAMDVLKTLLDDERIDYVIKGGYYVSQINGLGEFDKGKNSGWMYSVNGVTPQNTAASEYQLKNGDSVLWFYTLDYKKEPGSSGGTMMVTEKVPSGVAKVEVTAKVDAAGKATAVISKGDMSKAIAEAAESAKKAGENGRAEIQIPVIGADNALSVETTIPKESIKELKEKVDAVTVQTSVAEVSFDRDTIKTLSAEANGDIKITASKLSAGDLANLEANVRAEIGEKPVFDFTILSGSKTISEFGGNVTITVPYTATAQELAEGLVVYFINDKGNLELVKNCIYDEKTKTMTFTTQHFSKYAIGYKAVDFMDVKGHWAKNYITYLAARDVIRGMSDTTFEPNSNITRAQFVQILASLSGADLSSYADKKASTFRDVSETAWYANAVAWAADKGIATGTSDQDGRAAFNPDAYISRQDMAVMILRYTEKTGNYRLTATDNSAVFADDSQIAEYAKEAVKQLQQAGLLNGKTASEFAPRSHATRAESAKMISILAKNSF